jgi:hypothetical protein
MRRFYGVSVKLVKNPRGFVKEIIMICVKQFTHIETLFQELFFNLFMVVDGHLFPQCDDTFPPRSVSKRYRESLPTHPDLPSCDPLLSVNPDFKIGSVFGRAGPNSIRNGISDQKIQACGGVIHYVLFSMTRVKPPFSMPYQ